LEQQAHWRGDQRNRGSEECRDHPEDG